MGKTNKRKNKKERVKLTSRQERDLDDTVLSYLDSYDGEDHSQDDL